jgi:hypothetical protein
MSIVWNVMLRESETKARVLCKKGHTLCCKWGRPVQNKIRVAHMTSVSRPWRSLAKFQLTSNLTFALLRNLLPTGAREFLAHSVCIHVISRPVLHLYLHLSYVKSLKFVYYVGLVVKIYLHVYTYGDPTVFSWAHVGTLLLLILLKIILSIYLINLTWLTFWHRSFTFKF